MLPFLFLLRVCHLSLSGFAQVRTACDVSLTAILSWRSHKDFWDKSEVCFIICYTGSCKCCATLGNYLLFLSSALGVKLYGHSTNMLDSSFSDW